MFKKNQQVTYFQNWNASTTRIIPAIVEGCGKKQMTLRAVDGEMLGRNFRPTEIQYPLYSAGPAVSIVVATDAFASREAIEAKALELAANRRAIEIARLEGCLEKNPDACDAYKKVIAADLERARASVPSIVWKDVAK